MGRERRSHREGLGMGRLWGRRAVAGRAMGCGFRGVAVLGALAAFGKCAAAAVRNGEGWWWEWALGEGHQAPPH